MNKKPLTPQERGRLGGKAKVPKGFAMNRKLAAEQGKKRKKVDIIKNTLKQQT